MAESWFRKVVLELRPHAIWAFLAWAGPLAGAAMISALLVLLQKSRNVSLDWFLFGGIFLVSLAAFFLFVYVVRLASKAAIPITPEAQKNPASAALPPPDTSLGDWDPKIELELTDDRANYAGNRPTEMIWFTPINRGGGDAKIIRVDDVRLQQTGYTIACSPSEYRIAPHRHGEILLKIHQPNGSPEMRLNLFEVLWQEYEALRDPMRHDLPIPLKVSYQDEIRNLFVTDCSLVFDPRAYVNKTTPIARVENKSFARVALAASLLEAVKLKSR